MESLGLTSMVAFFESCLGHSAHHEQPLVEVTLFFHLVNASYETGSIIMTTNKTFGKWGKLWLTMRWLRRPWTASSTMSMFFSLQGDSYRMKVRMKLGAVDFL